ncbi:transporter [uncultured Thiodictyon sp.]|uniref:SphA family protein n=1 Tax=uncultured Thiodictyon sp. TaxID=1846217 RepID=UPI0025D3DC98|nr:transporter [uncultured Thiodictyon sp.]
MQLTNHLPGAPAWPLALALTLGGPGLALAAEGGVGHYLPGGMATLIDRPPTKPGWVVEPIVLHYEGSASASRAIPIAGTLTAGLRASSDAVMLGGLYTLTQTPFGAHYSLGAYVPYVWASVTAQLDTPLGTVRRRDRAAGFGDLTLIPAMLAWQTGFWQVSATLPVYAPTGQYQQGRLANPGLNYWTFDPTLGVSYGNDKSGLNASLYLGLAMNTENPATRYHSGSTLHLDASIQQLLPVGPGFLGIGAEAFYLDQVTPDSGAGARLGGFQGRTAGVGPVLSYVLPRGTKTLVAELRWLPEVDVSNRLKGDYVWLKLVCQFGK